MHIASKIRKTLREGKKNIIPRKLLAMLLALVMSVSTFAGAVPALAATPTSTITPNPILLRDMIQYDFFRSNGSLLWAGGFTSAQTNKHYINGTLVYCLQPNRNSANGISYDQDNWPSDIASDTDKKLSIAKVLAFGAPNAYEATDASILATQLLTWAVACGYVNGSGGLINSSRPDPFRAAIPDGATGDTVRQIYDGIKAKMAANANLPQGLTVADVEVYSTTQQYEVNPGEGEYRPYQVMAKLDVPKAGSLKLTKTSAVPAITNGNSCYSFDGATFGVYGSRADAQNKVRSLGTLTTDASGNSNTLEGLEEGKVYVRELTAPQGYALSNEIKEVSIVAGETTTVTFADFPQSDPVGILLQKKDSRTSDGTPKYSDYSLAGAEFTVRYYAGLYDTVAAAEASGAATRTWVFKTNSNGFANLSDNFKVSGDDLYLDLTGRPTLPIGTIIIQETKAPAGYLINNEKFLRKITAVPGTLEAVNTYNAPEVPETGMEMKLIKTTDPDQADKSGFTFEVTGPNSYKKTVTTPKSGVLEMAIPAPGTYTVKELPREGWVLPSNNPQTVTFEGIPGEIKTVTFGNIITPELKLTKTTDWPSDDPSGFQFEVTGPDGYKQTVTTNASGTWTLRPPAYGTYTVKELTTGKAANYQPQPPQTVTFDADHKSATVTFSNRVKRVELELTKTSEDGKVEGIDFRITGPEGYSVTRATDARGKIKLTGLLPGTYTATELPTADGRYRATEPQTITIQPGETGKYSFHNELLRGGVKIQKVDAETRETMAQGDGTLEGAEYEIISLNDYPVTVEGTEYTKGEAVYTLTTDANGYAETPTDLLPFGKYDLREKSAPEGYLLTEVTDGEFQITVDGELAEKSLVERPVKGRIQIAKHSDTGDTGVATPEVGAEFRVYLKAAGSYEAAKESERDIIVIPEDGFGISKDLPYGTYVVEQIKGWPSAPMADAFDVEIRQHNKTYSIIVNNLTFTAYAKVIKTDSRTGETIPVKGVGFNVYKPDGSKVVFFGEDTWYTGDDGIVRIPARLEYGYDYYLMEVPGTEPAGYILNTEPVYFDVTPEDSVEEYDIITIPVEFDNHPTETVFSKQDVGGSELPGAKMMLIDKATGEVVEEWTSTETPHVIYNLPIGGSYTLVEDTAPLGYVKVTSVDFTIEEDGITSVTMIDVVVSVEKLDYQGNFVEGAELAVYEIAEDGTETEVEKWISDGAAHAVSGLEAGKKYILRELKAPEGYLLADDLHFTVAEDISDDVTIVMENEEEPEIRTTATVDGSHVAPAVGTVTVVDRVFYDKLVPGREYTAAGKIMVKETGRELLDKNGKPYTASATFTPDKASGYVDVSFTIDASELAGSSIVVFETLEKDGKTLCVHADINDEDQTIRFPKIQTSATVNGSHMAVAAESVTIMDEVRYTNLTPGKEYTVIGVLMQKISGVPLCDVKGMPITVTKRFTPETADGVVTITFTINARRMAGFSTVVFENVYEDGILIATHADINDEDQTIHFPKIGTTATVNGKHTAAPSEKVTLIDTVSYTNLIVGEEYTVKGTLMIKETGKALLGKDGKPVTAELTFVAKTANGSAEMSFTFDASELEGKSVVVFEDVYHGDILIAVHADINDADQTVEFPDNPKTGDDGDAGLWAAMSGLSALSLGGVIWLMAKRRKEEQEAA